MQSVLILFFFNLILVISNNFHRLGLITPFLNLKNKAYKHLNRFAPVIIFNFYLAFLIDIIDNIITYSLYYVTKTSANSSAVYWSRVSCDNDTAMLLAEVIVTSYPTVQTIHNNIIKYIY